MADKKEQEIIEKNESEFQHIPHLKKRAFLAAYAECGTVTHAAEIAGISRRMVQYWKKDDPEFAEAFRVAEEKAADRLEQEARRRAIEGVSEPVFHKGEVVGTVQKYSDTLLIFLMKGARPEKYRERVSQVEITGKGGGPITADIRAEVSQLTPEERKQRIAELLKKREQENVSDGS